MNGAFLPFSLSLLPLHSLFNSLAASIVKWCTYIREKELSKCIDGRGTRNWSPVLEQRNTIYIQGLNLQSTKIRRIRDISLPSRSRLNKNKYNNPTTNLFFFTITFSFQNFKIFDSFWKKKYFLFLVSFSPHYHPTRNTPLHARENTVGYGRNSAYLMTTTRGDEGKVRWSCTYCIRETVLKGRV